MDGCSRKPATLYFSDLVMALDFAIAYFNDWLITDAVRTVYLICLVIPVGVSLTAYFNDLVIDAGNLTAYANDLLIDADLRTA